MQRHSSTARGITARGLFLTLTLLAWAAVASVLFIQDHDVSSAVTLVPAGLSVGLVAAFLAGPVVVARCPRCQRSPITERSHVHVERLPRDYFSPYACCPPDDRR